VSRNVPVTAGDPVVHGGNAVADTHADADADADAAALQRIVGDQHDPDRSLRHNTPQMYIGLGEGDTIPQGNGFYYVPVTVWTGLAPSGCVPAGSTRVFNSVEVAFQFGGAADSAELDRHHLSDFGFLERGSESSSPSDRGAGDGVDVHRGRVQPGRLPNDRRAVQRRAGLATFSFNADAPASSAATVFPVNGTYVIEMSQ